MPLTKSPKRENYYEFCFYMLEDYSCLILACSHVPKLQRYSTSARKY